MDLPSVLDTVACAVAAGAATGACALRRRFPFRARIPAEPGEQAAFAALHAITRASPPLRTGLSGDAARRSVRHLRALLDAEAVALVALRSALEEQDDGEGAADPAPGAAALLGWDGAGRIPHAADAVDLALPVLASGRPRVIGPDRLACPDGACPLRAAMIAPLTVGSLAGPAGAGVEAALVAYWNRPSAARVRAVGETARLVAGQLRLAELDGARQRVAEAEMRALRAQISPHFVYNSLTTIASFVRTDPERARELLLDFADFARYSFRNARDFTTLADELRSVDRYLLLERARFGERLRFRVEIAPEVLPVAVPFLALQPLVENAVRHGMADAREAFHISITARDSGPEAAISVEDDGVGMDPERLREILSAPVGGPGPTGWGSVSSGRDGRGGTGIGLANVDARMRQVYGEEYGLTVRTALGAGTRVDLRVPKYRPGVFPN
ncbi:histidine kinase [Actinomadura algeriensis]|uniref:histidine kinase n=1 Tax=Actinomadura algeriensis TaxID=1679523 RepID=A0ABR9JX79_9ACTN|nr:histidine kinase [Actinomadura algeriensis]MBE1535178.1 two-component system LytT family sensor kinase [Actinomadura algeriensis]